MDRREWWTAANILQQLIRMEPDDYDLYEKYAKCLSYLELDDAAFNNYNIALTLNPHSYSVHLSLGFHAYRCRESAVAIQHWDKCFALDPKRKATAMLSGYARCQDIVGNVERAELFYKEAIQRDDGRRPDKKANCHTNLGNLFMKQQRWNEAKEEWVSACKLEPHNPYHYWRVSTADHRMNNIQSRDWHILEALKLDPSLLRARRDYRLWFGMEYDGNNIDGVHQRDCDQQQQANHVTNIQEHYIPQHDEKAHNQDIGDITDRVQHLDFKTLQAQNDEDYGVQPVEEQSSSNPSAMTTESMLRPANIYQKEVRSLC